LESKKRKKLSICPYMCAIDAKIRLIQLTSP
jgi:hypothetical protein